MWDDLTLPSVLRSTSGPVATLTGDEAGRPVERPVLQGGEAVPVLEGQAIIG